MAEIQTSALSDQQKRHKRKVQSTRVDLTPMVDLGFLLITFFIFTTSMAKPVAMKMILPDESTKDSSVTGENNTLTLIAAANNKVFYYSGSAQGQMASTSYSPDGIRQIIINKKSSAPVNSPGITIILKSDEMATLGNLVKLLDEMLINDIHRYMLVELTPSKKENINRINP